MIHGKMCYQALCLKLLQKIDLYQSKDNFII
nr:MAG TPA: hypothetical protein [Caudoviricetes sp.]